MGPSSCFKRLFAGGSASHSYELTRARVSSTGVVLGSHERGGGVETADTAMPEPSEAEVARQERMKRED